MEGVITTTRLRGSCIKLLHRTRSAIKGPLIRQFILVHDYAVTLPHTENQRIRGWPGCGPERTLQVCDGRGSAKPKNTCQGREGSVLPNPSLKNRGSQRRTALPTYIARGLMPEGQNLHLEIPVYERWFGYCRTRHTATESDRTKVGMPKMNCPLPLVLFESSFLRAKLPSI